MKYQLAIAVFCPAIVAPRAGAWIEISRVAGIKRARESLPVRERGLKFVVWEALRGLQKSLPVRERGLKYFNELPEAAKEKVAPRAGAWIEICIHSSTQPA